MSKAKPATKAQIDAIALHCMDRKNYPQVWVMRKLKLKSHNDFYRLYVKVVQSLFDKLQSKV